MANPHHRKKRKHFTPPPHERKEDKGGAASIMTIFGAIIGLAIFYFAVQASLIWIILGSAAIAFIGYLIGKWMDKAAVKRK
jgi:VIT1/CCC1 family predicted Fe2+/Mn2+ transporter